jgi:hypothetical protein
MIPMRIAAIAANVCFIGFGFLAACYPVLMLHLILLPLNAYRLCTVTRTGPSLSLQRTNKIRLQPRFTLFGG